MKQTSSPERGFNAFLLNFFQNVKQWLLFMFCLTAFRLSFLLFFQDKIDQASTAADIARSAANGMRFDSVVATYLLLIPFLLSLAPQRMNISRVAERARDIFSRGFIILTSIAWIVTFVYFKEYDQQFSLFIFNLYYDDIRAILLTIWSNYHPLLVVTAISLVSWSMTAMWNYLLPVGDKFVKRLLERNISPVIKIVTVTASLLLIIFASRGTFDARPIQVQDVGVVADPFLNKAILNPHFSLLYAIQDHIVQNGSTGLNTYLTDGNVAKAAQEYFHPANRSNDLDAYLEKHAHGPKGRPPRHIFLILMESYDAWPFLPRYASLGLTQELTSLGREGIFFSRFLPSSPGTSEAFSVLVTSLPYPDLKVNYQYTAKKAYPSSLFAAFKRLGYRTRLFYGGNLSWQRFGDFAQDQGAEEIYGAPHMNKGLVTHEWGVDDEYLFRFVQSVVNDDRPSFNFILTTSYHPPFNVDVRAAGFPLGKVPDDLATSYDGSMNLNILGHFWYADKCLGEFTRKMEQKLSRPLFAYTGDHFSRRFINSSPDYYEQSSVPFILHGKDVLNNIKVPHNAAGSHLDVGPTLIELTAPKGFIYHAAGQDMLAAQPEHLGIGSWRMVGEDFLFDVRMQKFHPLPGTDLPKQLPDVRHLNNVFNAVHGVGWWRVKKGPELP